MNTLHVASLAFKIAGIFSITQAIPLLRQISEVLVLKNSLLFESNVGQAYPVNYIFIGIIASIFLLVVFGIVLILCSNTLSKKMFGEHAHPCSPETEITAQNIQSVAFSIVGVVLVAVALPKLVQIGANIQALANAGDAVPTRSISAGTWAYSIGMGVQMFVGVVLFVGSRGLSSLWYLLQKSRPMSKMNMGKN